MTEFNRINNALRSQRFIDDTMPDSEVYTFARTYARLAGCIVVVSDLKLNVSKIFSGTYARELGIEQHTREDSIWETSILQLLSEEEQNLKYASELRFFNYIFSLPAERRADYHLVSQLRFSTPDGKTHDVRHTIYYDFEKDRSTVRFGICIYTPLTTALPSRCMIVNGVTGISEPLDSRSDPQILSNREKQVLRLIARGLTSSEIATQLCISRYTVNRHRQHILSKLQVRNSAEAGRIAHRLNLI